MISLRQADPVNKSETAFWTIGELAEDLGVPQHVLRYWETRFPQLRPVTRAGNRRYYRPADVEMARRIHHWLSTDGYTIKGVQQLLRQKAQTTPDAQSATDDFPIETLMQIRDDLVAALQA
jgi:DNA-binding transcriptional MerR regulator